MHQVLVPLWARCTIVPRTEWRLLAVPLTCNLQRNPSVFAVTSLAVTYMAFPSTHKFLTLYLLGCETQLSLAKSIYYVELSDAEAMCHIFPSDIVMLSCCIWWWQDSRSGLSVAPPTFSSTPGKPNLVTANAYNWLYVGCGCAEYALDTLALRNKCPIPLWLCSH